MYNRRWHADNFTIPMATIVFAMTLVFMGLFALPQVRRAYYEIFQLGHYFVVIFFFMVLWHATMSWYYIAPGLTLYVIDGIMRFHSKTGLQAKLTTLRAVTSEENPDFAVVEVAYEINAPELSVQNGSLNAQYSQSSLVSAAGQLCFINIPEISLFEWHPFTVSSMPGDSRTTHHIKVMKRKQGTTLFGQTMPAAWDTQWTERLLAIATDSRTKLQNVRINVDGAYGLHLDTSKYSQVLLIAGGIGITPMQAHFRAICRSPSIGLTAVTLLWITQNIDEAKLFLKEVCICVCVCVYACGHF